MHSASIQEAKRPVTSAKLTSSKKRPPISSRPQSKARPISSAMSVQTEIDSDIVGRTRTPGVGQSDIAGAAASSIVTSGLLESVDSIEEDYSEDLIPEAAAEMGQGKYKFQCMLEGASTSFTSLFFIL